MLDTNAYPGENAELSDILALADYYCEAALVLFSNARKGCPLSVAPARLCAIHAVELFLNAFLKHQGIEPPQIRGRLHNLSDDHFATALGLRNKTAAHLREMTDRREYLISRYGPEMTSQHTHLNRLQATLNEVRQKLRRHLDAAPRTDGS